MVKINTPQSAQLMIALAFVAILVLSLVGFIRTNNMNKLSLLVAHSNSIKLKLQETYSDLSDADSELSRYLLTSNVIYRERMMDFEKKISASIDLLKSLTSGNLQKSNNLSMLDTLIQKRFLLMSQEIEHHDKNYDQITLAISKSNMEIISVINALSQAESNALIKLESSVDRYKFWTPIMMFYAEVIVISVLILAYFRTDRDLKVKRRLQHELEDQVQFVKAILDNSVDLIIVLDTKMNLVLANKKSCQLLGIEEEMVGQNIFTLFPVGKKSKSHEAIIEALKGEYVHIERHKAHSIDLTFESFFIPLYKDDAVSAVIIMHHDISAIVEASEKLEKKNNQLVSSNEELEKFAYVASHDLQEPLRKISTYSGLAEKAINDPEKLSSYLVKISSSARRMSNLIKDILRYSQATFKPTETESVDLNVVYRQVVQDLELTINEKSAIINSEHLPFVDGHTQQLSQVFYNLIHNALKFCDKQPVITIRCKAVNGIYYITISDNGIGFDQSYQDDVFQVFKRLPGKQEFAGTGVGLAVVKKIITDHNGSISVLSEVGNGTTFEIQLPVPPQDVNKYFRIRSA